MQQHSIFCLNQRLLQFNLFLSFFCITHVLSTSKGVLVSCASFPMHCYPKLVIFTALCNLFGQKIQTSNILKEVKSSSSVQFIKKSFWNLCVYVRVCFTSFLPFGWGSAGALSCRCKIDKDDLTDWMSFLPSNLMNA